MAFKHFKHLNVPDSWERYFTKYPQGMSILEALFEWVSQVDSMVDNQNKLNDNVEQFRIEIDAFIGRFDERLQTEVTQTLNDWQTSGFLDVVISSALQWQLDDYISTNEQDKLSLTAQLQQTEQNLNAQLAHIEINVKDYGVVGDGVTDDTQAIMDIINNSEANSRFVFKNGTFLVSSRINLKSDRTYTGINATLKMNDLSVSTPIFRMRDNQKNVVIEGFEFISERKHQGVGHYEGALVSHCTGISGGGNENLTIRNCTFKGMDYGIKLDSGGIDNNISENVVLNNITVEDTWTGFYLSHMNKVEITNIDIDAIGTQSGYLHPIYVNTYFLNARMENLTLKNSSGAGLIIQNSAIATKPTNIENVIVKNITIDSCRSHGISVIGKNILFEDVYIKNYSLGSQLVSNAIRVASDSSTVRINRGVIFSNGRVTQIGENYPIDLFEMTNVIIDAINDTTNSEAFHPTGNFNIKGCTFINWKPDKRLVYNNTDDDTLAVFESCKTYYNDRPEVIVFSVRGLNTRLIIKENDFFNLSGTQYTSLCYNQNDKGTIFRDNNVFGYAQITSNSDTVTKTINNWIDDNQTII